MYAANKSDGIIDKCKHEHDSAYGNTTYTYIACQLARSFAHSLCFLSSSFGHIRTNGANGDERTFTVKIIVIILRTI